MHCTEIASRIRLVSLFSLAVLSCATLFVPPCGLRCGCELQTSPPGDRGHLSKPAYFELLALDQQLQIARRTTNAFGESLKIFSQRLAGGIVSKLETSAAEAALDSAAATVPDLERQIVVVENQLNVLLGRNTEPIR